MGVLLVMLLLLPACNREDAAGSYPAATQADCLPKITLVDQHGSQVELASLRGKPILIDFVYTSCTATCPMLTAKMESVAKLLGNGLGRKARFVSLTLDPEHDGPAQLLSYSERMGANNPGWIFLTGTPEQIDQVLAIYGIRRNHAPDGSIMHVNAAYLLGPDGRQNRQYAPLEVSAKTVVRDIEAAMSSS